MLCFDWFIQVGKAATDVDNLGLLANQLTRDFDLLASDSRGAAITVHNTDVCKTFNFIYLLKLLL